MITMYVNRVDLSTGETLINLTGDTVTPETMIKGATAHNSQGEPIEGEFDPDIYQTKEDANLETFESNIVDAINGLNTDRDTLMAWYDETHYVDMKGEFSGASSGTFEIGYTVKSTFTWKFDKKLDSLTVGGVDYDTPIEEGSVYKEFTTTGEGSRSFTITGIHNGTYGEEKATNTWNYNFRNKVYYGCLALPDDGIIDSTFIKKLSKSAFATSYKNSGFNLGDTSTDKYIWYAFPARFVDTYGEPVFTMGGYEGGFNKIEDADVYIGDGFTNSQNFTESYCVYRSTNAGVGDSPITVS